MKNTIPESRIPAINNKKGSKKEAKRDTFRLRGQRIKITWMALVGDTDTCEDLYKFLGTKGTVKKAAIGRELAPTTGTEHYHAAVWYEKEIDTTDQRFFDYEGIHPNLGVLKKSSDFESWAKYCCKGSDYKTWGMKVGGIIPIVEKVLNSNSQIDAIKNCANSLKEVLPILQIYNARGIKVQPAYIEKYANMDFKEGWQKETHDLLMSDSERRSVHWMYEKKGNVGKSTFCDMMEVRYPDKCLVIEGTGSKRDIADLIRNWMELGNNPEIILIDLPRTFEDTSAIYTVLEAIKNGRMTCTKYKGANLRFLPPHVVVFANFKPNVKKMSLDRWHVRKLEESGFATERGFARRQTTEEGVLLTPTPNTLTNVRDAPN